MADEVRTSTNPLGEKEHGQEGSGANLIFIRIHDSSPSGKG
jgi:hypothetical protein